MKCKMCPICQTDDYDLIRNCELRGRYKECIATTLPYIVPPHYDDFISQREPKQERKP